MVEAALGQARAQNNPLAGVIFKGLFSPIAVQRFGVATAHIKIGKQESLCGILNFALDPTLKANASGPPA
jgi:hypothetical protein